MIIASYYSGLPQPPDPRSGRPQPIALIRLPVAETARLTRLASQYAADCADTTQPAMPRTAAS
jgi:hypothetical protein